MKRISSIKELRNAINNGETLVWDGTGDPVADETPFGDFLERWATLGVSVAPETATLYEYETRASTLWYSVEGVGQIHGVIVKATGRTIVDGVIS